MKSTIISQMKFFFALCIIVAFIPKAFGGQQQAITQLEVEVALNAWGEGLVAISKKVIDKEPSMDIFNEADNFVDTFYNYDYGANVVSFKPTVTIDIPFRETKAGALSYFVGGNPMFAEDTGFAFKKWTSVSHAIGTFSNRQTDTAIVQTQTTLTNVDGVVVKAYFSMVWVKVPILPVPAQGPLYTLKLDLHHSSLPYVAPTSAPTSAPTPKAPTPKAPTPKAPTPKVPTPKAPTPKEPTPKEPTPKAPTPKAPTQKAPTPKAPTRKVPTRSRRYPRRRDVYSTHSPVKK